jgi:hypothetical protein
MVNRRQSQKEGGAATNRDNLNLLLPRYFSRVKANPNTNNLTHPQHKEQG